MSFVVVMPAYNEAEGIAGFVQEIFAAFGPAEVSCVIIDDASSDATSAALTKLQEQELSVTVLRNERNIGHGPSTIRALAAGLRTEHDVVVAVDGDGQFHGPDIVRVASLAQASGADVVEGARVGRGDPLYRRAVSSATRVLVRSACGRPPLDANTPLRAYQRHRLEELLDRVPETAMTPNLLISASVRRNNWQIIETEVASLQRRGSSSVGTTWGTSRIQLPSKRFLMFCGRAFAQWRQFQKNIPEL